MAEKDGVTIPFNVEADGADVTIEKLAAAVVDLTAKVETLGKTAGSIKGAVQFTAFAEGVKLVKDAFGGVKGLIGDFVAEMDKATSFGSKFQNMSLQYNTSAEALQKLAAAGKPFGVSVDQMARSLNLLDRNFSKISPQFKKFGIDAKSITGDATERFTKIAEGIGKIKDPAQQAAASFALLKDRSGAFLKLIRDPEGVRGAIKDFEDFGLAVSDNAIGALDKLGNQKQLIDDIFTSFKTNLLGAIAASPAFQEAIRIIVELFGKLSKWAKDNAETIKAWVNTAVIVAADAAVFLAKNALPVLIDGLTVLALGFYGAKKAAEVLVAALKLLFEVTTKPMNAAKAWEEFKTTMGQIATETVDGVGKIVDANVALQNKAGEAAQGMQALRDRIADAAKSGETFEAPIKAAGDAAALSADQIEKLAEATKAWEEKMADVARTTANGFAELADKALPEVEQKINALTRTAAEEQRKLTESFTKENEKLAKQGLPGLDSTSLKANIAAQQKLLALKIEEVRVEKERAFAAEFGIDLSKKAIQTEKERTDAIQRALKSPVTIITPAHLQALDQAAEKAKRLSQPFGALQRAADAAFKRIEDQKVIAAIDEIDRKLRLGVKLTDSDLGGLIAMREGLTAGSEQAGVLDAKIKAVAKDLAQIRPAEIIKADAARLADQILAKEAERFRRSKDYTSELKAQLIIMLQQRGMTEEQAKAEADKVIAAKKWEEAVNGVLSVLGGVADMLGEIGVSAESTAGQFLSMAQSALQAAEAGKSAKAAWESGNKAGAVGAGLGAAGNIWKQNSQQLSGGKGALSGAASGAAFGAQFGPWGAAIGAVGGALIGFFAGSKFRKIAKDAGKVLGEGLSKETVSAIQEDMKKLDLSASQAALLHIGDAMQDTGKSAHEFAGQMNDLLKGIADGSIPAEEGIAALGQGFSMLAEEAEKAGTVGDRALVGLLKNARALGQLTPEMKAFVSEQLDSALEGVHKFVAAVGGLSDEAIKKLGKDSGVVFGAMFDALVSERGIVAAVDALKDDYKSLHETLSKTLGPEAVGAILGPFGAAFDTLGNEKLRPIFEGIDGLTQAMKGLANAGFLSTEQFSAMQHATSTLFDEAIAGGADMKTALLAVSPGIQSAISAAEQFGVPLDADTQRLKDLAEQNGITFKTDPQQAMLDVLVEIAKVMGADIPESVSKMRDSVVDGTADMTSAAGASAASMAETVGGAATQSASALAEMGSAGQEAIDVLQGGTGDLASSLSQDIPDAAADAMKALQDLQTTAAKPVEVGGGGAAGGTQGPKNVQANVSVNLGINENPLAAADTAAAMRKATVDWTADAIQDRIPGIVASIEEAMA